MDSNNTGLILCITSSVAYFSAFFVQHLAFLFKGISRSTLLFLAIPGEITQDQALTLFTQVCRAHLHQRPK